VKSRSRTQAYFATAIALFSFSESQSPRQRHAWVKWKDTYAHGRASHGLLKSEILSAEARYGKWPPPIAEVSEARLFAAFWG
jgi:hypothetical protein